MESRCYHGGEGRTRLKVLKLGWNDLWAFLIMAAMLAAVILMQKLVPVDQYVVSGFKNLIGWNR